MPLLLVLIIQNANNIFPNSTEWFLSGRSALRAILADIQTKRCAVKAYLPSWCCDSMIIPFLEAGFSVSFYPVFLKKGALVCELPQTKPNDVLLLLDYFGYASLDAPTSLPCIVIRDLTHSVFSKNRSDANYYFGSLRKWSGFTTGGFAWGIAQHNATPIDEQYVLLRKKAMQQKASYIAGHSDKKNYLSIFAEAEMRLETNAVYGSDTDDIKAARFLDVDFIKTKRRQNASFLLEAFSDIAVFPCLGADDCPLFVPILLPNESRDALRRHLISQEIYCPIHWPVSPYHELNDTTAALYAEELSLVCDQRYDEEDMTRMINAIKTFKRS